MSDPVPIITSWIEGSTLPEKANNSASSSVNSYVLQSWQENLQTIDMNKANMVNLQKHLSKETTCFMLAKKLSTNKKFEKVVKVSNIFISFYDILMAKEISSYMRDLLSEEGVHLDDKGNWKYFSFLSYIITFIFIGEQLIKDVFGLKIEILTKYPEDNGFIPSNGFITFKFLSDTHCYGLLESVAQDIPLCSDGKPQTSRKIAKGKAGFGKMKGWELVFDGMEGSSVGQASYSRFTKLVGESYPSAETNDVFRRIKSALDIYLPRL